MTIQLQSHPGEEALERYSLGHLSESELEKVEEHLFICELCQTQLVQVEHFMSEMKAACQAYRLSPEPAPKNLWQRLSDFLAVPRLVYGGALAAITLALILPITRFQSGSAVPDTVNWDVTYRGSENAGVAEARAKHPLHLAIGTADLSLDGSYRVQIVDQDGRTAWTGTPTLEQGKLMVKTTESLGAGIYWVRLYGSDNSLLREFGLHLN